MKLPLVKASLLAVTAVLLAACANRTLSADEEVPAPSGEVPLKLTADILPPVQSRVTDNRFETGDAIGVFGLAGNTTLTEERYMDNLRFVRSDGDEFTADGNLSYYPDDGVSLNLICYYPYRAEGMPMGESFLPVSVDADQSVATHYSRSQFMTALKENLSANQQAVPLSFRHRFFRLNIVLIPGDGETVEKMLEVNPTLSVSGFYTKARYDFKNNSFSAYEEEKVIIPAGAWEEKEGCLEGKSCILIPQDVATEYHYLTLTGNGKTYTTFLPSGLRLEPGRQRTLEVTYKENEDVLLSRLDAEIADWEGAETDRSEAVLTHKYVDISKLSFAGSHVYRILHAGTQVAEICKEYLSSADFAGQAIVAYPMTAGGDTDHSRGIVIQCLTPEGKADGQPVHGGKVSWNASTHSLTYTAGNSPASDKLYVLEGGTLALSVRLSDKPLPVLPLEDCIRDVRGGVIRHYPLVKIGTQYWLRSDLQATKYTDGTDLPILETLKGEGGYLQPESGICFYTSDMALSDKFLPSHCSLPTWDDWNVLKSYLKNDASLLKAGQWNAAKSDTIVQPVSNLSGFTATSVGLYVENYAGHYEGQCVGYWTLGQDKTSISEKALYLNSTSNTMDEASALTKRKAFPIRCLVDRGSN